MNWCGELLDDGARSEAGRLGPGEVLQSHEQVMVAIAMNAMPTSPAAAVAGP